MKRKIGIIGFGNMGSAIAERLKAEYAVFVFDKDNAKLKDAQGLTVCASLSLVVEKSEAIILAVKPQDFDGLLSEIKSATKGQLFISIAAGITTAYLEKILIQARVVRVMPNLPAKIGMGMSCLCKGKFASEEDLNLSKTLFDKLGKTLIIEEKMMDAATAVSGSGPGYFFDFVQGKKIDEGSSVFTVLLTSAAQGVGFSKEESFLLSSTTVAGSVALLAAAKISPAELVKQVASKGGTTEAGLEILHKGGSLPEAVEAARIRAEELSKKG
jgi:pyrroline-5-carboxylate reductase